MATANAAQASQRFEATVVVTCPGCKQKREIAARTKRRNLQEQRQPLCNFCRQLPKLKPTEEMRRYWLEIYGANPNGCTAITHVRLYGLPPGLADLIETVFGPRR